MSERELIQALQQLIKRHTPALEPRKLSNELMLRDRWRVRMLAGITALLWLGGIAGILYMVFWFNRFIIAYRPLTPMDGGLWEAWILTDEFHAKMELHRSLEYCMVAVPALLLAALGTVWLVFSTRQATLNQINLSLGEIADQLRHLRPSIGPFPKLSPFSAIRWKESTPEVQVMGSWYEFLAIDDTAASDIVAFCQDKFGTHWQKRYEEDLVQVMAMMGHELGDKAMLKLRNLVTGNIEVHRDVPNTHENRQAIWRARNLLVG
jgi:hypothetical protein